METSNKLIIVHHTLPFGWKTHLDDADSNMTLRRALGRAPSSTDLSVDQAPEDPFPHLHSGYGPSTNQTELLHLNRLLESAPSVELVPHMNHPALFDNIGEAVYVGWPGGDFSAGHKLNYPVFTEHLGSQLSSLYADVSCHPVFLKPKEAKNHFEGYCKNRLWSILHYSMWRNLMDLAWEQEIYDDYVKVNREFAAKVVELWRPGDFGKFYTDSCSFGHRLSPSSGTAAS